MTTLKNSYYVERSFFGNPRMAFIYDAVTGLLLTSVTAHTKRGLETKINRAILALEPR